MPSVHWQTRYGLIQWYVHCDRCHRFWTSLPHECDARAIAEHHRCGADDE